MSERRDPDTAHPLRAFLLGRTDYVGLLALQRRLVYEVSGERTYGVLVLTEHPLTLGIGREGSLAHVRPDGDERDRLGWAGRRVNRGGGCWLHAPGQVAAYAVLPLDAWGLTIPAYLDALHDWLALACRDLHIPHAERRPDAAGVWAGDRAIAHVGVAVSGWVAYHGAILNVAPDLEPFRLVDCDGCPRPMTSVERETRTQARPQAARSRLLDRFAERFGCSLASVQHSHPALPGKVTPDARTAPDRKHA